MPFVNDWQDPETWITGETINADTWNDRVYEPLSLLLRRPLTVARRSTDRSIAASSSQLVFDFDVIDKDDDGMVTDDIAAANITNFYAQRDGVYAVYFTATWESGSHQGTGTTIINIFVNGSDTYRQAGPDFGVGTTTDNWRAVMSDINLAEGDYVSFIVENTDTNAVNIKAQFNAPRAIIFWKRPLGS